jgi:RHS repeat-associated protein
MSAPGDSCSGLSWSYDAWANRTAQTPTGGTCHSFSNVSNAQNQLVGYQYDAAGNMTFDSTHSYTYDAEERLTKVDNGNTASYVYAAAGQRVQKNTPSGQSNYWLDLDGNTAVEGNQNSVWMMDYIYVDGSLLGQYENGTTVFLHHDHLGSTRLITALNQSVSDSMDYLPYGEQIAGDTGSTHKFTGKERDAESQLDNFGARYYSSALGRWASPDSVVFSKDFADPQTLNKYSYVFDRPLVLVDPDGNWPGWYHHIIIHDVFGNLGQHAEDVLIAASDWVDSVDAGNQAPERSFMHAMRDGEHKQSVQEAERQTENYINTEIDAAVNAQMEFESKGNKGDSDDALNHFGHALHTVTDRTSPEHRGYQPWYCLYCYSAWKHHDAEEDSAKSANQRDEEARYQAHVETARLWNTYQSKLKEERKKKKKKEAASGLDLKKDQSGYSVGH